MKQIVENVVLHRLVLEADRYHFYSHWYIWPKVTERAEPYENRNMHDYLTKVFNISESTSV